LPPGPRTRLRHRGRDRRRPGPRPPRSPRPPAVVAIRRSRPPPRLGGASSGLMMSERKPLGHDFALVDPAFDADPGRSSCGPRRSRRSISARRVCSGTRPIRVAFGPRHLGTAEAAGDLDLHAPWRRSASPRSGARFIARRKGDPVLQLLGDRLGRPVLASSSGPFDLADVSLSPGCR